MIIKPKVRGFICTTAHPEGCTANILQQINYVKQQGTFVGPQNVLIIGSSTGYGLASRITAAFGAKAKTLGVFFEKPAAGKKTASAGWYNSAAFEKEAHKEGLYAKSINGDAFSNDIKQQVINTIQQDWQGKVDLIIYSLAAPRRRHPVTGEIADSVLKPVGQSYNSKTVDILSGQVTNINIEPANDQEIQDTISVMGGEDWQLWIDALMTAEVLAKNVQTIAYSYIGPEFTYPIYRNGTIGLAKEHLEKTAITLNSKLAEINGAAYVAINKGLVTQSSSAIPVVPLYISILYKVMKQYNCHENCIEQMTRLFKDNIYKHDIIVDDSRTFRLDNLEMQKDVQQEVAKIWQQVITSNIEEITDIIGYRDDFYKLFGFKVPGIDYDKESEVDVVMPSFAAEIIN